MKNTLRSLQHGMTASIMAVALFVTGAAALAATDTGPDIRASGPTGETTTAMQLAVGSQMAVPVADAGFVTIERGTTTLRLVSAIADPGWQAAIEVGTGRELEVSFRSSTIRHDANFELEDGQVRIRIRTRDINDSSSTTSTTAGSSSTSSTSTVPGSSTSTTTSTRPDSSTSGPTSTTTPATTLPISSAASRTVAVLDAGTADFVVEGGQLKIVATTARPGWGVTVERSVGREVEASWRGDGRVDLNLELEDGMVRVRIRDRRVDVRTEERIPADGSSSLSPTTPTIPATPTTPSTPTIPPSSSSTTVPTSTTTPSTTTAASPPASSRTEVVSSTGGTVTVTISGNNVTLLSAVPTPGYLVDIRDSGGDEVEVRFEADDNESRIRLRVSAGTLHREIEDR